MKILAVSDNVLAKLENRENLLQNYSQVNAVISCGDMPAHYLEFIVDVLNVPLLYVRGNHDVHYTAEHLAAMTYTGVCATLRRIAMGRLGGLLRYNPRADSVHPKRNVLAGLAAVPCRADGARAFRRLLGRHAHACAATPHPRPARPRAYRLQCLPLAHSALSSAFPAAGMWIRTTHLCSAPTRASLETEVININPAKVLEISEA